MNPTRSGELTRKTRETEVCVSLDLDGTGKSDIQTGIGFFDHMLEQVARHGLVDLKVHAKGDLYVDGHHTVEDVGIALGDVLASALGDKKGVRRYGFAYVPLDESLSRVVLDLSGRPGLVFEAAFTAPSIGGLDTQLVREFFRGFANHAMVTLHVDNLRGENAHHQAESIFKAFGRALRMAVEPDPRMKGIIPSTKGLL
ncbi:imidazoleglycerol-phosphate dehydratase HisB [Mesosutterella sp. OilRF-GAM-744-9]|uniref:Imidazoleglycerol-phosphate dehydratase n=1 Tax=Mesosutterella porci TaxID=2915351 RepID=A0ABS9MR52_9BURK|nr:imidazoleglycerol-phosphate dehydratase HisB [Mesosutterella sp. oilRF-744-WT-GAM-9]MCG5031085.1 imidazoleglycerol-phosphate dehydratase HisB [Mesosutterella sp. oilRF-744-WT-GAM-9]MCI6531296.1 imidazoleglycerol-phosphate dehydratase HisB [Mesosutterella sp.]